MLRALVLAHLTVCAPAALAQATQAEPRAVRPASEPNLSARERVLVRHFVVVGATRWSSDELRRLVLAQFEGRELSSEDLESIRRRLTRWYVEHGYVNSGALIPDQNVAEGIVRIQVVEGRLSRIEISGNRHLDAG